MGHLQPCYARRACSNTRNVTNVAPALAGMACVCSRVSGQIVLSAASGDSGVRWDTDQHKLVEAWSEGRLDDTAESARAFNALASALGDRKAARELLLGSLPRFGRAIATEDLTIAAERAGLEVAASSVNDDGIGLWRLVHRGSATSK